MYDERFENFTWNFFEAGHGKSAADAVGGVLKRMVDRAIDNGSTITTAEQFFTMVGGKTSVQLLLIAEEETSTNFQLCYQMV